MEFLYVNVYYTGCPVPNPSANPKLPSTKVRNIQRAMTQQCLCDLKQCLTQFGVSLPINKQDLLEVISEFLMYPRVRNKIFKVKKDQTNGLPSNFGCTPIQNGGLTCLWNIGCQTFSFLVIRELEELDANFFSVRLEIQNNKLLFSETMVVNSQSVYFLD